VAFGAGGGAPAVTSSGAVYVTTGNGVFDANTTPFLIMISANSILRLDPSASLTLTDCSRRTISRFCRQ